MRTMFLRSLLIWSLGVAALPAQAQRRYDRAWKEPELSEPVGWSLGMNVGLSDLWGDIGTKSPIHHYANEQYWENPKFMGGLYLRYAWSPALAARVSANFGTLYAHDNWNKARAESAESIYDDPVQRYIRNQDVRSYVWEGTLLAELMPFRFNRYTMMARKRMQPYLMLGVGAFNHRSQSTWKSRPNTLGGGYGQWVDIHELHLEGDGWNFDGAAPRSQRWNINFPVGLGLRWDLGRNLGLGVEYLFRYTRTDFLDGVSGKYLPAEYYGANLPADKATIARDVADKSWQVLNSDEYYHQAGEMRGNASNNDHYSTLSVNFFYKINYRLKPWWF